jgi:Holliday junction resolvase RusA-like endonuclease
VSISYFEQPTDLDRAGRLVVSAGALDHTIFSIRIEGEPIAKARARVTRHRAYTPQRTLDAEADIASAVLAGTVPRFDGNVAVAAIFYRSNRHRIDVDNLMKTVLDGITKSGAVWHDDSHVTAIAAIVEFDPDWPRTAVAIAPHVSSLLRGDDAKTNVCETCGAKFRPHSASAAGRFCSRACRPKRPEFKCMDCGGPTSAAGILRCRPCANAHRRAA